MFTSSQKNTAFRSINAYENRYEMQICILRPEKARFSHPVIARNRCREHAQHAPLMKGRSSGSGIIIVSRLPGFPVAYLIRLLRYSGGTARAFHPFPYYPAEKCRHLFPLNAPFRAGSRLTLCANVYAKAVLKHPANCLN